MYRKVKYIRSRIGSVDKLEGETIEQKIMRIMDNGEAIKDGAPEIFTERKQGVLAAYNIRTDRWEIACEAMDVVNASRQAKREEKGVEKPEMNVVEGDGTNGDGVENGV